MPKVFLSHGFRDAELAAKIARELRKHGVEPVDVFELAPQAEDVRQAIKSAIRRADGFVLILGMPEYATSGWTSYELGMAEALGMPILLLLSHNHATDQLPFDMVGLPIVSYDPKHPELAGPEIVDRLLAAA